jgi:hypothetical protein
MAKSLLAKYRGKRLAAATGGRYVEGVCDGHSCIALPRSAPPLPAPSSTTYRNALHPKVGVFRSVNFMACATPRSLAHAKQMLPMSPFWEARKRWRLKTASFMPPKLWNFSSIYRIFSYRDCLQNSLRGSFLKTKSWSFPNSQQPITCPYPEPHKHSEPHLIHFNKHYNPILRASTRQAFQMASTH